MGTATTAPSQDQGDRHARGGANGNGARASTGERSRDDGEVEAERAERLANGLGWFSIGLGLAELAAPDRVAQLIGVDDTRTSRAVLRFFGAREVAAGVGILTQRRPTTWVWARVAGDALDLAALGTALKLASGQRGRTGGAIAAVAGVAALDVVSGVWLERAARAQRGVSGARGIRVRRSITVNRPVAEVYAFWRNFENLPRFMQHLEDVEVTGARSSHWRAAAPAGLSVEWDAEITQDDPNSVIAWQSVGKADVANAGTVRFRPAPGNRGTEVHVALRYDPPGGVVTAALAKLFREEPNQQVYDDLRAFKQVLETGEVIRSDASLRSGPRAAQPRDTGRSSRGAETDGDRSGPAAGGTEQ